MMPYNFDFGSYNSPLHHEFGLGDIHPSLPLNGHEQTAALHSPVASETTINSVVHNASQPVAAAQTAPAGGLGSFATVGNDIKRHDFFSGDSICHLFKICLRWKLKNIFLGCCDFQFWEEQKLVLIELASSLLII